VKLNEGRFRLVGGDKQKRRSGLEPGMGWRIWVKRRGFGGLRQSPYPSQKFSRKDSMGFWAI
jgi:hypothetical protein